MIPLPRPFIGHPLEYFRADQMRAYADASVAAAVAAERERCAAALKQAKGALLPYSDSAAVCEALFAIDAAIDGQS